jgi:hypothetical protein
MSAENSVSSDQFQQFVLADRQGVFTQQFANDPDFPGFVVKQLSQVGIRDNANVVGRTDNDGGGLTTRFYAASGLPAFQAAFKTQFDLESGDDAQQKSVNALCKMTLPPSWQTMIKETLQGMAQYPNQVLNGPSATEEQKVAAQKIESEMPTRQANMFVNMLGTRLLGPLSQFVLGLNDGPKVGQALIRAVGGMSAANAQQAVQIGQWLKAQTGYCASDFQTGASTDSPQQTPRPASSGEDTGLESDPSPRGHADSLPFAGIPVPLHVQARLDETPPAEMRDRAGMPPIPDQLPPPPPLRGA